MNISMPNREFFNQQVQNFDKINGTKTRFCNMTLKKFLNMASYSDSNNEIDCKNIKIKNFIDKIDHSFNKLFDSKNTYSTNIDKNQKEYNDIMKLNSWYHILTDYRKGIMFYNPLCVHVIDENLWIVDPGNSRLALHEYYLEQAQFMMVFYNMTEFKRVKNYIELSKVLKTNIDISGRTYRMGSTPDDNFIPFLSSNYPNLKLNIHHVLHNSSSEFKYHKFENLENKNVFRKENDIVFCNNLPFAIKEKNWKFLI